jgi:hypothetical protein
MNQSILSGPYHAGCGRLISWIRLLSLGLLLSGLGLQKSGAQTITNYAFTGGSPSVFTPLAGGTTAALASGDADDGYFNSLPIGFPFIYNGQAYTTFSASTNGFMTLGAPLTNSGNANNLTSGGSPRPIIAPLWDNLNLQAASNFSYQTAGVAGSRILTVQWLNEQWNFFSVSFQAKLYEANGRVEFVYRQEPGGFGLFTSASIGITEVATGSGNFLSLNGTGNNPTASSTTETTNLNARPASGQFYRFNPVPTIPTIPNTLTFSNVGYTTTTVSFNDGSTNETGFVLLSSTNGGTTYTVAANLTSTTVAGTGSTKTVPLTGLTPATTYTYKVLAVTEGRYSNSLIGTKATLTPIDFDGTPYTIDNSLPTAGTNFHNFADAFLALNNGSISASSIIDVVANGGALATYDEAPLTLNQTATAGATLTFRSAPGNSSNPVVQGTLAAGGGTTDAIITLSGSDYIAFDRIDLTDNPSNTTAARKMERGLQLTAASATNGCQHVSYLGGTITLDKAQANTTTGIYSAPSPTAAGGTNSNLTVTAATLQDMLRGIQLLNSSAAFSDQDAVIGTTTLGEGNNFTDIGGPASANTIGVEYSNQNNLSIAGNNFNTFGGTGSISVFGISTTSNANGVVSIVGNQLSAFTAGTTGPVAGISLTGGSTATASTIRNNTVTNFTATANGALLSGIVLAALRTELYDNTVSDLNSSSATNNTAALTGIRYTIPGGSAVNMYRNYVHSLTHSTTGTGSIYGLYIDGTGTTVNLYNNMVANLVANNSTGTPGIRAINLDNSGATDNVYYNSVYLSGTATSTAFQSAALYFTVNPTTVDYRNNILVNDYARAASPMATSRSIAVYRTVGTLTALATGIDNNLLYGNTALYYNGSSNIGIGNNATALAAYVAALGGTREAAVVTEIPPFMSNSDPHLDTSTPTQVENGAQRILTPLAIANDRDQEIRQGETGYVGSGSSPDIGAHEGNFPILDLTAPAIAITTPLGNTTDLTPQPLSGVTITDYYGVNTTAGTKPRLYYRIAGTSNAYNNNTSGTAGFKYVEASGITSPFTLTMDFNLLPGNVAGTMPPNTTLEYFVTAEDIAATPNVGVCLPNTCAAAPTSAALTSTAFPVAGALRSYTILETFAGTITVGPGQTYNGLPMLTFTGGGGLFARLNAGVLTGDLTVLVTGNITTEDGSNVLNPPTEKPLNSNFTIRVQPSAAALRTISGWSAAGVGASARGITLNGADRIVFDGRFNQTGPDKFLLFRDNNVNGGVFNLIQDATNNVIRNVIAESATTVATTGAITFGNSQAAAVYNGVTAGVSGNDNNLVLNCDVRDRSDVATAQPAIGVYSVTPALAAASNSNNTVQDCNIFNFTSQGVGLATGTGGDWTISGNSLYNTGRLNVNIASVLTGVSIRAAAAATNILVSGNYIGGSAPLAGGTAWGSIANSAAIRGIQLVTAGTSSTPATTISGNSIGNLAITGSAAGTGSFIGIDAAQAAPDATSYLIADNTVSGVSSNSNQSAGLLSTGLIGISASSAAATATAQTITGNTVFNLSLSPATAGTANVYVMGIQTRNVGTAAGSISRNRVYNLSNAGTAATAGVAGIGVSGGLWTIANNQVTLSNSSAAATPSNAPLVVGLADNAGAASGNSYYFNSVRIGGAATGSGKSYGFRRSSTATNLLRNNICINQRTGGGGNFAVGVLNTTNFNSNYNDLFAANAAQTAEVNTTAQTFANWKAQANTPDLSSPNALVSFVSTATGNLNIDPSSNCVVHNTGVVVVGVNGEFDSAATNRQTTPDIGSDEFTPVVQTATITTPSPACGPATISVTITGPGAPWSVVYTDGVTPVTVNNVLASPFTFNAPTGFTYSLVSVTDASGCTLTTAGSVVVMRPTATITNNGPVCPGSAATLTLSFTGTGPWSYTYTNGITPVSGSTPTSPALVTTGPLAANTTFTLTAVADANCTATTLPSGTLVVVNPLPTFTVAQTNVACFGGTTGSITVTASGGTGSYEYSKNGGVSWQASNVFSGLSAAPYSVLVRNLGGAQCPAAATQTVTITEPAALTLIATPTPATCASGSNGSISISGGGGTGPYQYNLNGGSYQPSGVFSGLAPGLYTVGVRDANSCTTSQANVSVGSTNPAPTAALTNNGPVCGGDAATATLTLGGSTGPWTITYTVNGLNPQTVAGISTSPYLITLPAPLAADQTIALTALSDDATGCVAFTPLPSTTVTVHTLATWNGNVNSDWTNVANWSNACVPNQYISAMIPAGRPNYPSFTTGALTAAAKDLTIAGGASLVFTSGIFELYGNLANSGTMSLIDSAPSPDTGSELRLRGTAPTVAGLPDVFDLTVNGSGTATLSGTTTFRVYRSLTMTAGLLNTGSRTAELYNRTGGLYSDATISETDLSHVLGKVSATQNVTTTSTPYTFGGMGVVLTPTAAAVVPGSTQVTRFTGAYLTGVAARQSATRWFRMVPTNDSGLECNLDFSYFDHERNGISDANLWLFSTATTASPSPTGPWAAHSASAGTAPVGTGYGSVALGKITHLSDWTLGDRTSPLPVQLTRFEAVRKGFDAELGWNTASEKDNRGFEVQVSTDGREFHPLHFITPASPNSSSPRSYVYTDREDGKQGIRYYRLRQLDLDGTEAFSPVRTLSFESATANSLSASPNPFGTALTLQVQARQAQNGAALLLTDAAGRTMLKQSLAVTTGYSKHLLAGLERLPSGVYFLHLTIDGELHHLRVVKQ